MGGQGGRRQVLVAHEDAGDIAIQCGQQRAAEHGQRRVDPAEIVGVLEHERGRPRHRLGQLGRQPAEQGRPARDRSRAAAHELQGGETEPGVLVLGGGDH